MKESDEKIRVDSFGDKLAKGDIVYSAFNEYKLISIIGQGGNGKVWKANDKYGESVAIKFIERDSRKNTLKRFKNETFFCIKKSHKNIVKINDYGTVGEKFIYYVMPLYEMTLKERIKEGLSGDEAIDIFVGIIEGLKYAHENNVIHRDIKPENILLDDNNNPVIADFGIAHFPPEDLETIIETKKGDRMANFLYAAPEQKKVGGQACFQSDIYAAGLILNEMFTKEVPQAAGYKTIGETNNQYSFLDQLFEKLFQQKAEDRLYPEDKILNQLKVLSEKAIDKRELDKLEKTIIESAYVKEYNVSIKSKDYINGELVCDLGVEFSEGWFRILYSGNYEHTCVLGYGPQKLHTRGFTEIAMPFGEGTSKEIVADTYKNIKNWIATTNTIYNNHLRKEAEIEMKEKEKKLKAEIERIKEESKMKDFLADL